MYSLDIKVIFMYNLDNPNFSLKIWALSKKLTASMFFDLLINAFLTTNKNFYIWCQ